MSTSILQIELLSETTPSRGVGTAGEVDIEVDHDAYGLPLLRGKTLHGLLLESWLLMAPYFPELQQAGVRVFGQPGDSRETAILRIGDALLPEAVRAVVRHAVTRNVRSLTPDQILRSLTGTKWQTAQSRESGVADDGSLRVTRVLIPGLRFTSPLTWLRVPETTTDERCLALSVLATRQLGVNRNRGCGYVKMTLAGDEHATRSLAGLRVAGA